ncbi:MAG TPA: quercetin 2,3-dioxygenase, partial [Cyanobacteria bacterium UBA9579]|nr:quercetin 2,3-dioxygenase [Cyanobacteria bacterium UBA9579]
GKELLFNTDSNRYIWIQVISGSLFINSIPLKEGDGASIVNQDKIELYFQEKSEILLFDLA